MEILGGYINIIYDGNDELETIGGHKETNGGSKERMRRDDEEIKRRVIKMDCDDDDKEWSRADACGFSGKIPQEEEAATNDNSRHSTSRIHTTQEEKNEKEEDIGTFINSVEETTEAEMIDKIQPGTKKEKRLLQLKADVQKGEMSTKEKQSKYKEGPRPNPSMRTAS